MGIDANDLKTISVLLEGDADVLERVQPFDQINQSEKSVGIRSPRKHVHEGHAHSGDVECNFGLAVPRHVIFRGP